jgi:diguanylate cyclase (GGDEF)-like protein
MLVKLAQAISEHIEDITGLWVLNLRRTERTEVHKTMLTAEIISGTKGILASLANAIAEHNAPDHETIPISLVSRDGEEVPQPVPTRSRSASRARGSGFITSTLEGSSLSFAQEAAAALGRLRHKQGYQIHEVLLEYVTLRQALWDTLRMVSADYDLDPSFDLPRYLDRLFDEIMLYTMEAFYEAGVRDLEKRAIRDPLTQLYNKEYFAQRLHEEMRRALRYRQPLTLALIDMDRLKEVNDTYGHQAGDATIKAVTRAICDTCRQIDIPCRYGGDEFAVILPETTKQQALAFAERALRAVRDLQVVLPELAQGDLRDRRGEDPEKGDGNERPVPLASVPSISIGLATFPEDGRNPETLISKADSSLYRAKRRGRNMVSG